MTDAWAGYSKKDKEHTDLERKWAKQNFRILGRLGFLPYFGPSAANWYKGKLLDVGCSWCFFIFECRFNGIDAVGVDVDPEIIDGNIVKYCDVNKDKLPFKKETFHMVFSSGVLQHLEKPPVNLMKECRRVLKKDGYLVFHVRNEKSWINLLFSQYDNFRHKSTWSKESLKQMFEYYGFDVVYLEPKFLGIKWLRYLPFKFHIGSNIIIVGRKL